MKDTDKLCIITSASGTAEAKEDEATVYLHHFNIFNFVKLVQDSSGIIFWTGVRQWATPLIGKHEISRGQPTTVKQSTRDR